ncbi:MAG TPA: HEAT repeat domain-containing protein [Polyangia bacterium]
MPNGIKAWIAGAIAVALLGAGALILRHTRSQQQALRQRSADGPTSRGLAASDFGTPALPPLPETKEQIAAEVTTSLGAWRQAILVKDAETVMTLDRAFLASPDRYRVALAESAKAERDERVRAFSTRELGKYKNPALAGLFQTQLADKSAYVRQNAAWALGELAAQDDGRTAALRAVAELRLARAKDPAADVRSAAKSALARLE